LSTELLLSVVDLVLGSVAVESDDVLMLEVDTLLLLLFRPVLSDPVLLLLMLLLTELLEALELDLLRFSLELLGCCCCCLLVPASLDVVDVELLRALRTLSIDL